MGTIAAPISPADALFPEVLQRVLGLVMQEPDRAFQSAELIRRVEAGTGAVHRLLKRLVAGSLLEVEWIGSQKFYRANRSHPVFEDLRGLVLKTVGLAEPLKAALSPVESEIDAAFVFGSVARGEETAESDVDLMILSDTVSYSDLYEILPEAEAKIGRSVEPHLQTLPEWRKKLRDGHFFTLDVSREPKIFVVGSEDVLEGATEPRADRSTRREAAGN